MNLWIRSQDKENLVKCNEVGITEIGKPEEYLINPGDNKWLVESRDCFLGFYKTKERALEVLDDIQKSISNNAYITTTQGFQVIDVKPNHLFIYIMPEE